MAENLKPKNDENERKENLEQMDSEFWHIPKKEDETDLQKVILFYIFAT